MCEDWLAKRLLAKVNQEMMAAVGEIEAKYPGIPKKIVITYLAPSEGAIQAEYQGEIYILITKPQWMLLERSMKESGLITDNIMPIQWLSGIPIVEDDELARKIWRNAAEQLIKPIHPSLYIEPSDYP